MSEPRVFILAHESARRNALQAVAEAPKDWRVDVRPPRRNGDINAALHAKLGEIAARMPWAGHLRDIETWKRLMVAAWCRACREQVELLPAIDGHGVDIVFRRTSHMSQAEVRDLMAFIEAWAAEQPELQDTTA